MRTCKHYRVSGLVQGVGFRYYTQCVAIKTGLSGWVRNLGSGDVEVVACGTTAQLQELYDWLCNGPPMARVDIVETLEATDTPSRDGFVIR